MDTKTRQTSGAGLGNTGTGWLAVLRCYLVFIAISNLIWEIAQLPLYTIWTDGTPAEIAFAVVHCTAGDVLIAGIAILSALLILGTKQWPNERYWTVAIAATVTGIGITIYSEWLNTEVRGSWAYTDLMPTLPLLGAGLSPVAQWIVLPIIAFWRFRPTRIKLT